MGRPSLADVRQEEILDAFATCVARYGLAGSTSERVAEVAGMKRSILRHYVGNRDDLVEALADRVLLRYREQLASFRDGGGVDPVSEVLEFLFPRTPRESTESILVIEALMASGHEYPRVVERILEYVEELISAVSNKVQAAYPTTPKPECWATAYGVVSICFNQESLGPMGLPQKYWKAARSSARRLIESHG